MGSNGEVTLTDILRFYIPLAATSVLMMVTHSVISGAVARTFQPAIALAAYSAAYSVGQVFESSCYAMHRMALTFVRGRQSFRTTGRVALAMLAILISGYVLVAWTPLSRTVFQGILGLSDAVYAASVPALRVFILWPLASATRSIYQSLITLGKRTYWLTINMAIRVTGMLVVASTTPAIMPGGPVGSVILSAGISIEAILAFVVATKFIPPLSGEPDDVPVLRPQHIVKFMLPLAAAAIIQTLAKPVVTASLSRMARPEVALAGFQVASSFSYIFVAVTYSIYHAVVIFVKDRASFKKLRAFILGMGGLASVLLLVSSLPPFGSFIFSSIIGAPPDISLESVRTLSFLALTPIALACAEFFSGILMLHRHSEYVTAAKVSNVAVTSACVLLMARAFPAMGGAAASLATAIGGAVEAAISYGSVRSLTDTRHYLEKVPQIEESIPA